jgi:hypothetical protein
LYCWLQLSWLPLNHSCEGDRQFYWILIGILMEYIYIPAVLVHTVSKVELQPAVAALILIRCHSVSIMRCAVGVQFEDASPWWCWLLLDTGSITSLFPTIHKCS